MLILKLSITSWQKILGSLTGSMLDSLTPPAMMYWKRLTCTNFAWNSTFLGMGECAQVASVHILYFTFYYYNIKRPNTVEHCMGYQGCR